MENTELEQLKKLVQTYKETNILKKAIKVVTRLKEQDSHIKGCGTIYIPTEDIEVLEDLLISYHEKISNTIK